MSVFGEANEIHSRYINFVSENPVLSFLVGGFNPVEKYARQIGSFSQVVVKTLAVMNVWFFLEKTKRKTKRIVINRGNFLSTAEAQ